MHLDARRRGYGRTSSDNGWFLSGVPAPLPGQSLRTDLARFSASANDNFGQTKIVIHLSPVTDVLGRIRRCQRSTCVTAALPAPKRGKRNYARDFSPRMVGMIAQTAAVRQWPRPNWHSVSDTQCQNKNSAPRLQHGAESMHTCSKRHLLPGQRSADDIAVCTNRDLIRQLALRW